MIRYALCKRRSTGYRAAQSRVSIHHLYFRMMSPRTAAIIPGTIRNIIRELFPEVIAVVSYRFR